MTWLTLLSQASTAPPPSTGTGDETSLIVWGLVLLTVALVLVFVEVLVPSGGLIGLVAAACAVGGVVCITFENTVAGLIASLGVVAATPFLIAFALKIWPNTPLGRRLILGADSAPSETAESTEASTPSVQVGARGKAVTPLRPVGTCLINGQRIECLGDGTILDAGVEVEVIDVDGNEVHVRPVRD